MHISYVLYIILHMFCISYKGNKLGFSLCVSINIYIKTPRIRSVNYQIYSILLFIPSFTSLRIFLFYGFHILCAEINGLSFLLRTDETMERKSNYTGLNFTKWLLFRCINKVTWIIFLRFFHLDLYNFLLKVIEFDKILKINYFLIIL